MWINLAGKRVKYESSCECDEGNSSLGKVVNFLISLAVINLSKSNVMSRKNKKFSVVLWNLLLHLVYKHLGFGNHGNGMRIVGREYSCWTNVKGFRVKGGRVASPMRYNQWQGNGRCQAWKRVYSEVPKSFFWDAGWVDAVSVAIRLEAPVSYIIVQSATHVTV